MPRPVIYITAHSSITAVFGLLKLRRCLLFTCPGTTVRSDELVCPGTTVLSELRPVPKITPKPSLHVSEWLAV